MPSAAGDHSAKIQTMLRQGPKTAHSLMEFLGTSQPTVSRALKALGDEVVQIGAARSIQYSLRDRTRAALQASVYRVSAEGKVKNWAR